MPTYHFHCRACMHDFALKLNVGSALPSCPECKSSEVQKVIVPPMIHFKGTGFYKTDSTSTTKTTSPITSSTEKKDATKPDVGKSEPAKAPSVPTPPTP